MRQFTADRGRYFLSGLVLFFGVGLVGAMITKDAILAGCFGFWFGCLSMTVVYNELRS